MVQQRRSFTQKLKHNLGSNAGHIMSMTPEQLQAWRWEREIDERNRPLSDEELDAMFPEGYRVSKKPKS